MHYTYYTMYHLFQYFVVNNLHNSVIRSIFWSCNLVALDIVFFISIKEVAFSFNGGKDSTVSCCALVRMKKGIVRFY